MAVTNHFYCGNTSVSRKLSWKDFVTEYAKAYDNSEKWLKYFMDKTATVAILPSGEMLPIDKQSIETHFCFGESGYDAEDAAHMAHVARTNENYFKKENMKSFDETISLLKGNDTRALWLTICKDEGWGNKHPDSKLVRIKFLRLNEIIDALGGSCFLEELPGKEFTVWNDSYRVATNEEKECILAAYEQARAAHEKKVDAYLKRYGTSKVHSWTYWRDA